MSVVFPINSDPRFRLSTAVGGETSFSVPFPFQDNDDIGLVRYADANDVVGTRMLEGTHYTLSGVVVIGAKGFSGGTITLLTPALAGQRFLRVGNAVLDRVTSIIRNGKFNSLALDTDLDRWILIAQELYRDVRRAWKAPYGQSPGSIIVGEPGSTVKFDEDGNLIQGPSAATIEGVAPAAQQALIAKTQAELAALAAGAPLYPTVSDGEAAASDADMFLVSTEAGVQVYQSVSGSGVMQGWLGKVSFKTVANLLAFTGPLGPVGTSIEAQGFRYEVLASGDAAFHIQTVGGVRLKVLPLGDRMYFAAFGLVGGDADETALLLKAFAAAAGYELRSGRAQTYRTTESLQILANTDLNLRGSTINFACVGQKRNLEVYGSNVGIRKGRIRNVVGSTGFEGSFQTPIVIGRYQELAGFRGVIVEDMSVETVLPNGNGIAIFGDSENIDVRRIVFPNSAFIGRPIMAHWSFNTAEVNLGGAKKTSHQKNLRIHDIWCGTLSLIGTDVFNYAAVFLSAVYSAEVSNITIENFSRGKAVAVYAGDWGFQYAQKPTELALGSRSISVKNVYGRCFSGIEVYMKNPLDAPLISWPVQVSFDNINLLGYGTVSADSRGILLSSCEDVTISNSLFDGFYYGAYPTVDVKRFGLRDSTIKNSRASGLLVGGNGAGSEDWSIRNNFFKDNNVASVASSADVRIYGVSGVDIDDNVYDSPLVTWNVRLEGGATTVRHAKLRGNRSKNVLPSAGPCFSIGSASDTAIVDVWRDNIADVIPANGIRGGQAIMNMLSSIAAAPQFIGQEAYSGGNIYRAVGTATAADWKQIT